MKKYYYFYKITNNINNHFYYGIHSTNNINDGYMGSGKRLHMAYEKYGIDNFSKEILKYFNNWEDLLEYERKIVTNDLVKDPSCYNMIVGGKMPSEVALVKHGEIISTKNLGDKNGSFNTKWMTNGLDTVKVQKQEVDAYLDNGYVFGRTYKNLYNINVANKIPRVWVHKGDVYKRILVEKLNMFLEDGWKRGKTDNYVDRTKRLTEEEKRKRNIFCNGSTRGRVCCENIKTGERKLIDKNDKLYNIDWIPITKNRIKVIDEFGNIKYVKPTNEQYITGKLKKAPSLKGQTGKTIARLQDGSYILVDKNDSRFQTGELVSSTTGLKYTEEQKQKIRDSKCVGQKTWIHKDIETGRIIKFVFKKDIENYIQDGFSFGRGKKINKFL